MKKFYTVFDRDEKVLGFSIANQNNFKSEKSQTDIMKDINTPYDNKGNKDIVDNGNNGSNNYNGNSNNGQSRNNGFHNFLEIPPVSKILFKDRNSLGNDNGNKFEEKSKRGQDDIFFVHP